MTLIAKGKDGLLAAAKVLIALFAALVVLIMAMLLAGLGLMLTTGRGEFLAKLAGTDAPDTVYWAYVAGMVLVELLFFAALRFLLELLGIVRSVDRGQAFEPANADRLSRMGWLGVAMYGLAGALGLFGAWVERVGGEPSRLTLAHGLPGTGGVLLILVLFILARVFRQGAAMRDDLAGTV